MTDFANVAAAVATTLSPPRITPTVGQSIRVDWGSWITQGIAHEKEFIEAAIMGGLTIALAEVPFGSIVLHFIGPKLIDQYIDMALVALKGATDKLAVDVPADSVFGTVAGLINANEPAFAAFIGGKLDPMIHAALRLRGITVPDHPAS